MRCQLQGEVGRLVNLLASKQIFPKLLEVCFMNRSLKENKCIHALTITLGPIPNQSAFVHNNLISCYLSFGDVFLARKLFDRMCERTVVSYNTFITAYSRSGDVEEAWDLLSDMRHYGFGPTQYTLSGLLSCKSLSFCQGVQLHGLSIKNGHFYADAFVGTALLCLFGRHGCLDEAVLTFEHMPKKSLVTWNSMLSLLAHNGFVEECKLMFRDFVGTGAILSKCSFLGILPGLDDLEYGEQSSLVPQQDQFHGLIVRMGYESYEYVLSSLITSYAHKGLISEALNFVKAFDSPLPIVPSNIIAGIYNRTCQYYETVKFLSLLENPDVVSWNVVIAACARSNNYNDVFELFKHMHSARIHADNYTFTSLLCVCSKICSMPLGSSVHGLIIKTNFDNYDTLLCNVLIDMYGKCGSIDRSVKIFEGMADRNLITWTVLITALGLNGYAHEALQKFQEMELTGLRPDTVALSAVLGACRHGGFVREGMEIFREMKTNYGIQPELNHYHCIVDLLAKNGHTGEAEKIIASMPFPPKACIWRSFLEGYKR